MEQAHPETLAEMMRLTAHVEKAPRELYKAGGINLGMNIGQAAEHPHTRIAALAFITAVRETRVHPEELETTYEELKSALNV